MAKKTAIEKVEKSEKGSTSGDKGTGEKTPMENSRENEEPVELEPFTPTGNFEVDFSELCTRAGFPSIQVVPRPHRPPTPNFIPQDSTPIGKQDKKDAEKKEDSSKTDETGTVSGVDISEEPPSTYNTKEKYTYFKPRVEVETEEEGNKSHIKEIYVRGWRIDDRILKILSVTLPPLDKLTTLDFWNTGLKDNSLNSLADVIPQLPSIRTLSLDNNPLILQRYEVFLGEESTIQHFSLRNCYVNDTGAKVIGRALTTNKSLTTLNLCYNKVTSEGATSIAKGLRMNRTLLSLNLGSNLINDIGASKLAEVLSSFALSHEEIVARRLLISKKTPEDAGSPTRNLNAPAGGSKERPASVRSGGHLSKEERKSREKGAQKKKETKKQETEKAKKIASTEAVKNAGKGKRSTAAKGDKKVQQPEQEQPEVVEFPNPLLEVPLKEENGDIIIPGNRALINLNLSRNKVGEIGLEAFLISIQRQMELSSSSNKPTGLMRLTLSRNNFSPENGSYQRLMEIMQTRDPFYKPPQPSPADETSTSNKEE